MGRASGHALGALSPWISLRIYRRVRHRSGTHLTRRFRGARDLPAPAGDPALVNACSGSERSGRCDSRRRMGTENMRVDHSAQRDQLQDLRGLRAALLADLEPQITLAMKIGVLQAAGHRRGEIERQLGCTSGEFARAALRIKSAAKRLDNGDDE
jgi:hypothetical protein